MPSISVVCPTYNSVEFVARTLDTVMAQTRRPDELIISDDGSSDDSVEVVETYLQKHATGISWRVLKNAHQGPGATRNRGIEAASCDWVAFLDSDDLWEAEKLARVEQAMLDRPTANFFCHNEQRIDKAGRTSLLDYGRRYDPQSPLSPQVYLANMFSTSAVVCRRELLVSHGGFDETLMSAQDYELWLRISGDLEPVFIEQVLGKYVERDGNITSGKLINRMRNELFIAWMHRKMVSLPRMMVRVLRIAAAYLRQFVLSRLA